MTINFKVERALAELKKTLKEEGILTEKDDQSLFMSSDVKSKIVTKLKEEVVDV